MEQEALAIIKTVKRFNHFFTDGDSFHIHTDNKSLKDVFDPASDYIVRKPAPGQGRLLRWCGFMNDFRFDIHHINGEDNVFADLISRLDHIPPDEFAPLPDPSDSAEGAPSINCSSLLCSRHRPRFSYGR